MVKYSRTKPKYLFSVYCQREALSYVTGDVYDNFRLNLVKLNFFFLFVVI